MTSQPLAAPALLVRTVEIPDPGDLPALLPSADARAALAWVRRGEGIVGWGEAARIETGGMDRFARADSAWAALVARATVRDDVGRPGTGPVAFGSFAFSGRSGAGATLVVPQVVVGRRDGVAWLTVITDGTLGPVPDLTQARGAVEPRRAAGEVTFADGALAGADWTDAVARVVGRIRAGEVSKVVMAREVLATTAAPTDARAVLGTLGREYASCWTFAVDGLVGATPELLARREHGLISSRVLAGTIRRTGDAEADLVRAATLAHSSKDLEEHEYAVDSLADSLRPYAASTSVPDAPFVLHLPNVMHLATDVTAVLEPQHAGMSALAVAAALHPTAAVCGTPTLDAAEVIAQDEGLDRGRYAGPVGWIGADGDGEFGIALRCGRAVDERTWQLFAGCGVVAASDPAAELAESEAKLAPMRTALRGA